MPCGAAILNARDFASLSHGPHTSGKITRKEQIMLEGLGWQLCRPMGLDIARHVIVLFLMSNDNDHPRGGPPGRSTPTAASTGPLLWSICERIEVHVSDYGASASLLPSRA